MASDLLSRRDRCGVIRHDGVYYGCLVRDREYVKTE